MLQFDIRDAAPPRTVLEVRIMAYTPNDLDELRPYLSEIQSRLLLRHRLTGCLELLPVGRVLECLVELRDCRFGFPLMRQRVAPALERVSEVRSLFVGGFELHYRAVDITL